MENLGLVTAEIPGSCPIRVSCNIIIQGRFITINLLQLDRRLDKRNYLAGQTADPVHHHAECIITLCLMNAGLHEQHKQEQY